MSVKKLSPKASNSLVDVDDLLAIVRVFLRNWYILVAFVVISLIVSYLYTYKLTDVHAAKTQILLKSDQTYNYQDQIYRGLGYYGLYQDNFNQIRVITSKDLIEKTISKLKLDVSYYIVGRLRTTEVYQSVPFELNIRLLNTNLYEKEFQFQILDANQYRITYKKGKNDVKVTGFFNKELQSTDFFVTAEKKENLNPETIESLKQISYLFKVHDMATLVYQFKNALNVENLEYTSILELTLEDVIPTRAVTFLDTLSAVYIDYTQQSQFIVSENTLANIDKQLKEVTDILTNIEDDLESYKADKSILDLPKEEDEYFSKMVEYDTRKRNFELWNQSLIALEKYILKIGDSKDEKLLPPSIYVQEEDKYLQAALDELYTMQMKRNGELFDSKEESPRIIALDEKIELLRKNLLTYIGNSKKGIEQRIRDVEAQINDYTSIVKRIPKKQRDLLNIERKLQVNEKMYIYLLEKRSNTIIARAGIIPEAKIIESARSIGIIRPNKRKIAYFFLLGGVILALGIVFVRHTFFYRIQSIDELKKFTTHPVLGQIPLLKSKEREYLIVDKDPKSAITESFRAIRTNLQYLPVDSQSKVLLVTSFSPGEGKTFCSVNIATILAKAGKRVLLLEMDLHKPKVQLAFKMESQIGVTSVLIGKSEVAESIRKTGIEEIDVILSGPIPPNASELLLSNHMEKLFEYGRANYDYVIVDTPPIGMITDALVLTKYTDVTLFVVNTKFAQKQVIRIINEIIENNQFKNFGFILNGVKQRKAPYYLYNYGYGYGYGYGYSYGYGYGYGSKKNLSNKS